jgi:MFS family permease
LLAGSVTKETYGRAFGFERMMDTVGAIVGPATAFVLLPLFHHQYRAVFAVALVPGLLAAGVVAFLVKERERKPVPHVSFGQSLRALPRPFRRFLMAIGLFGIGDFAHTMLILLAAQKLAPAHGASVAASIATGLYVLHNMLHAAFSMIAGWLGDRLPKGRLLAGGFLVAALMGAVAALLPMDVGTLVVVFALGGIYMGMEETLEDSLCAELVDETQHGMAFGALATVNGIGDFVSSLVVGLLWTALGTSVAFGYSAVLFIVSSGLVWYSIRPTKWVMDRSNMR